MSTQLLVMITLVEIVALVAALALYLILIIARLRSAATTLGEVAGGMRAVQDDVAMVGTGTASLNRKLEAIANALPPLAEKAESLAAQRR